MICGKKESNFGVDAKRDSLLQRDMARHPYSDPTSMKSPDHGIYKVKQGFTKLST
jgi:hypothetical protein